MHIDISICVIIEKATEIALTFLECRLTERRAAHSTLVVHRSYDIRILLIFSWLSVQCAKLRDGSTHTGAIIRNKPQFQGEVLSGCG